MSGRVPIGAAADFPPGERRIVETDRGQVGVFNLDGEYHAMVNTCIHQRGPVCEGQLEPELGGEFVGLGDRVEERFTDRTVVKCPWHGWEYLVETGELLGDPGRSLPTFDVTVEDGTVYLEV